MISHVEMLIRIALGAALGGIIGFERHRHGRPVGLRTHSLVAMGAATFMVVSAHFAFRQHYATDGLVQVDASRIAASVVSGIGFIAGGAILRTGPTVQGLTTAAALWLVTAIGLCSGAGMYVEAVVVTGLGLVELTVLRRLEDKDRNVGSHRVCVVLGGIDEWKAIVAALEPLHVAVHDFEYERRADSDAVEIRFGMDVPADIGVEKAIRAIEGVPGLRRIQVRRGR